MYVKNSWDVKCRLVDIHWDMKHVSSYVKLHFPNEIDYRRKLFSRILTSILNSYKKGTWLKSRKRTNPNFEDPQPNVTYVQSNINFS